MGLYLLHSFCALAFLHLEGVHLYLINCVLMVQSPLALYAPRYATVLLYAQQP